MRHRSIAFRQTVFVAALLLLSSVGLVLSGQSRGAELAYYAHSEGNSSLVVTAEHGNERRILGTDSEYGYYAGGTPEISPNGRYVAYCENYLLAEPFPHYQILISVMNINTTETVLYGFEGSCSTLDFSPDGQSLLYGEGGTGSGMDIWERPLNESEEPRKVVGWNGDQYYGHYAADGTHIVFSSDTNEEGEHFGEKSPYDWNLFKSDLNGENATNLTIGSSLWTEDGDNYAFEPDVRVNNETIAFQCGNLKEKSLTFDICTINMNGTGGTDLGIQGYSPSWNPDGESLIYTTSSEPEKVIEISPTGEELRVLPFEKIDAKTYGTTGGVSRQSAMTLDNVARNFRPEIRLDDGERWRPLELNDMLEEQGARICLEGNCSHFIFSLEELGENTEPEQEKAEEEVLDIPPVGGQWDEEPGYSNPNNYGAEDCTPEEYYFAVDCEDPEHDAIYYDTSHVSPGGYRFLEYWFFYRFNDSPVDEVPFETPFDHEADWEHVAIGVANTSLPNTFEFVVFGQHDGNWAYMRENLSCEEGESCGELSKHVNVFPAEGTHASYAGECTATLEVIPCTQQNEVFPDGDHGGEIYWIGDHDAGLIQPLPPIFEGENWSEGPESFTDWPGQWGFDTNLEEGRVASPAGHHEFAEPWGAECSPHPCEKEEEEGKLRSSAIRQNDSEGPSSSAAAAAPKQCRSWFGPEVTALLCSPARLGDTLEKASIGSRRGSATITVVHKGQSKDAPATGGLVQLGGKPLVPGDKLLISGDVGKNAVLMVRTTTGTVGSEAVYPIETSSDTPSQVAVIREPVEEGTGTVATPVARTDEGTVIEPEKSTSHSYER